MSRALSFLPLAAHPPVQLLEGEGGLGGLGGS